MMKLECKLQCAMQMGCTRGSAKIDSSLSLSPSFLPLSLFSTRSSIPQLNMEETLELMPKPSSSLNLSTLPPDIIRIIIIMEKDSMDSMRLVSYSVIRFFR